MDRDPELLRNGPVTREVSVSDETVRELLDAFRAEMRDRYAGLPDLQKLGGKEPVVPEGFEPAEGRFFGLYDGPDLIACGGIRLTEPGVAEVKRMYVVPGRRGEGHGRRVLARLEDEARSLGCERIQLDTGVRQPEAQALYRSAGYARLPLAEGMPEGFVFMEKLLTQ